MISPDAKIGRRELLFVAGLAGVYVVLPFISRGGQRSEDAPAAGRTWLRQANVLAELYAKELGKSKSEYIDGLPRFKPLDESFKGRLYSPLLVQVPQGRLTRSRMLEVLGVTDHLTSPFTVNPWVDDEPKVNNNPVASYAVHMNEGSLSEPFSANVVGSGERGGTIIEGLALLAQKPNVLRSGSIVFPGSQFKSGRIPYLYQTGVSPVLDWSWENSPLLNGGLAIRDKIGV